jgi:hypothetical protein
VVPIGSRELALGVASVYTAIFYLVAIKYALYRAFTLTSILLAKALSTATRTEGFAFYLSFLYAIVF